MPSFFKTYEHRLDGKKRFSLPSDWRKKLAAVSEETLYIVVTEHRDAKNGSDVKCLQLMRQEVLDERLAAARARIEAIEDPDTRDRTQQGYEIQMSMIEEMTWDSGGRTRISDTLMEQAGIEDEVILIGRGQGINVWGRTNYNQYFKTDVPLPIKL